MAARLRSAQPVAGGEVTFPGKKRNDFVLIHSGVSCIGVGRTRRHFNLVTRFIDSIELFIIV